MRYLPILLLFLLSCNTGSKLYESHLANAKRAGFYTKNVIIVENYQEFVQALGSDRTILLKPGRYKIPDSDVLGGGTFDTESYNELSDHYEDMFIHDVENLSIIGMGDTMPLILQPDAYNHVLKFKNVENLYIENVKVGHAPQVGWCVGGVVFIHNGSNIMLHNTHLFGSGTEGLTLISVNDLVFDASLITGCSEQLSTISHSSGILFDKCSVIKNTAGLRGFAIQNSEITFTNCILRYSSEFYLDRAEYGKDTYDLFFYIDGDHDLATWHVSENEIVGREEPTSITFNTCTINDVTVDGPMK